MIKTKDGYAKLIGTTYSGSVSRVLLSNGGDHILGNSNGNIPLNNGTVNTNLNADMLDGLHIHAGRNNEANKIVRTDANGFLLTGWINTTSGNIGTGAINKIYCSNDDYIRYKTPANFFPTLANSGNDISITVAGLNRKLTVGYATNTDKLDGYHADSFTKKHTEYNFNSNGTAPYNYVWLCRIGNKNGYSGLALTLDINSRYHKHYQINILISTGQYAYSSSSISINKSDSAPDVYYVRTANSSDIGYDYFDIYVTCSAWNSGGYKIINTNVNGNLSFTNKCILVDSIPSGAVAVGLMYSSVNYANSSGNADKVDGYHANGLLTALSNANNGVSITVGGTTKSISNISVSYANSSGNADTVDGYHASKFPYINNSGIWKVYGNSAAAALADNTAGLSAWAFGETRNSGRTYLGILKPSVSTCGISAHGTIAVFGQGDTHLGIASDYSGANLQVFGGNADKIVWRKKVAFTSDIPTVTNYYWADLKISNNSNTTTNPTVALLKATTGVQIGSTADYGWYLYNNRICAGINVARDINTGSLLVSSAWADSSNVPTNGIYSKGNIYTSGGFIKSGSSDSYVLLGGGSHKLISDFATSNHAHSWSSITNKPCTLISYSRNGENINANNWRVKECSLIEIRNTELTYSNLAMSGFNSFFNFWTPDGIVCTQFQIGSNAFYYRSKQSGSATITTSWHKVMDSNNCSVSKSGETLTVKINGTSQSLTNTWRGILDNLTSSTNTTQSLSAKQGYLLANGYARDNTKLPLSGGTMTGVIKSTFSSNTWINGVTNAIVKGEYTGYGAILSMPVKTGRVSLSSYPANDNNIYFGYATTAQISAGTNSFNKQMYWDAANNNLHANVFTGSLAGNASTATNATNADKVDGLHFNWNNNKNDHTYLWAATDNGNAYLVHRASISVNYANSSNYANSTDRAKYLSGHGVSPNNSHPGHGARVFYSWDIGQVGNDTAGYSNGITIGSNPSNTNYGFQIVQNMWDDRTYTRRYNGGWQSWKTLAWTSDIPTKSSWNYDDVYSKLGHTHDDRYYTESEVNNLLSNKLNISNFNWTNLSGKLVAGNEFNIVNDGFNTSMWFNHSPINDRSKTASINGYHFGNGAGGYTSIKASGFIKNGSSDSYVLLGDGSHKAVSDFATSGHNHDNRYVASVSISGNHLRINKNGVNTDLTIPFAINADKLDGKHASAFALSSHTHSYLPLAGGTMSVDARISYNSDGNLYIGNSSNDGWVYVQDMASQNGTTYWNITQAGSATFKGTVTAPTFSGNATTATTASKLGSSSVGSDTRHFYLNAGTATASTATVGGTAKPMYLKSGVMTAISVTVGSASKPVYLNGGTITACSSSLTDYLPLTGGNLSGDLYVTRTSDASVWARYLNKTAIRMVASSSGTYIQCGNYSWNDNVPLYITGPSTKESSTLYIKFSTVNASGSIYASHFYENSDIRYKRILKNLLINSNTIANLPLFDFEWVENNTIGTGTSALAVLLILPNLVSGTDKLTLDYGVLGTIAGITACKELVILKSELLQLKEKVKLLEDKLRKYENI